MSFYPSHEHRRFADTFSRHTRPFPWPALPMMVPEDEEGGVGENLEHHSMMWDLRENASKTMAQLQALPAEQRQNFHIRSQMQLEMMRDIISADTFRHVEQMAQAEVGDPQCPLFDHNTGLIIAPETVEEEPLEFFELAPELREMVLAECLVVGTVFHRPRPEETVTEVPQRTIIDRRYKDWKTYTKPEMQLLLVCRRMLEEPAAILYRNNHFVIGVGYHSWPWDHHQKGRSVQREPGILRPVSNLVYTHIRSLSIAFNSATLFLTSEHGNTL